MRNESKDLIVGLDIGTSKVVVAVAEVLADGRFQVIGLGQAESQGLRKGVVVNIEATVQSIRRALEEAEEQAEMVASQQPLLGSRARKQIIKALKAVMESNVSDHQQQVGLNKIKDAAMKKQVAEESAAGPSQEALLAEIRDLLARRPTV